MSRPRAVTNPIDFLASIISDVQSRLSSTELSAHRHDSQGSFLLPAGAIVDSVFGGASPNPDGFLLLNGQLVANAINLYPALWAVAPAGWIASPTDLLLPTQATANGVNMVRAF